mmetsp:Transcript_677/g.2011  ORF Transcript_677/g.2011 Transcript_677/m.2011 type:complete len:231 (-) Transcript_677:1473-2165(-)
MDGSPSAGNYVPDDLNHTGGLLGGASPLQDDRGSYAGACTSRRPLGGQGLAQLRLPDPLRLEPLQRQDVPVAGGRDRRQRRLGRERHDSGEPLRGHILLQQLLDVLFLSRQHHSGAVGRRALCGSSHAHLHAIPAAGGQRVEHGPALCLQVDLGFQFEPCRVGRVEARGALHWNAGPQAVHRCAGNLVHLWPPACPVRRKLQACRVLQGRRERTCVGDAAAEGGRFNDHR